MTSFCVQTGKGCENFTLNTQRSKKTKIPSTPSLQIYIKHVDKLQPFLQSWKLLRLHTLWISTHLSYELSTSHRLCIAPYLRWTQLLFLICTVCEQLPLICHACVNMSRLHSGVSKQASMQAYTRTCAMQSLLQCRSGSPQLLKHRTGRSSGLVLQGGRYSEVDIIHGSF